MPPIKIEDNGTPAPAPGSTAPVAPAPAPGAPAPAASEPVNPNMGTKKILCDCKNHQKEVKYRLVGELTIRPCARRCPFCSYETLSTKGQGATIRKHIKNMHVSNKETDKYRGVVVRPGKPGGYQHDSESSKELSDSNDEDQC